MPSDAYNITCKYSTRRKLKLPFSDLPPCANENETKMFVGNMSLIIRHSNAQGKVSYLLTTLSAGNVNAPDHYFYNC